MKKFIAILSLLTFIFAICIMCTIYFFDLYVDIINRGVVMDDTTKSYLAELIVEGVVCLLASLSCIVCGVIIFFSKNQCLFFDRSVREEWHAFKERRAVRKAQKIAEQKQARIAELESELNELKKDGE